jgi:hypothetical protein
VVNPPEVAPLVVIDPGLEVPLAADVGGDVPASEVADVVLTVVPLQV